MKGKLPQFFYIFCKTKPLGKEFKNVAYYVTGTMILLEVQIVKELAKNRNDPNYLGE